MPADWQLPPGVSRGLWDYLHDPETARNYDAHLANTPLLQFDQAFVLKHCSPGRLLDLGCGTGRLAVPLAQRGYRVVAVDLAEEMLRVLGTKAAQAGATVDRVKANIVEMDAFADASFDHVACLFSTLGMIAGADQRRQTLAHAHRLLRHGGVLVVHVHNRWFHLWTRAGRRLLLRHFWDALLGRVKPGDFLMPPHHGVASFPMHLFTRRELTNLLREAGFNIIEMRPIPVQAERPLRMPWFLGRLRCYGYLVAARRP
jgi:SAM-dependent methyltransferase